MGTGSTLASKEVPIVGSDAVRWIDLSVPSSSNIAAVDDGGAAPLTTDDRASCFVIGDPPTYLIWRIHKAQPHSLELLELAASKEFPRVGLRFTFPDALCPFAFICKNEISGASRVPYLLYVLTVSGVAYLLKIRNVSVYASVSVFPVDELLEVNVRGYIPNHAATITAVTATVGGLVVGTSDGSVFCFQLGVLDSSAPGFMHELRDDAGISRLWGLISRGKMVGTVQELAILELHEKKFVFVLHLDGTLRIWDLASHSRVFSNNMGTMAMAGATFVRLWVGQPYPDSSVIPLAVLYRDTLDESLEMISLYSVLFNFGDRIVFSMEPSVQNIPLEEGRCLDVKLTLDKIWILKDDELVSHTLSTNIDERLLLPGVHHNATLYATLVEYSRHLGESELQTLTTDGLKKEILSLIEHEVGSEKVSLLHCWKCFFTRYFHNWCKNNALYGLLVDSSSDAVGLIRKKSISLFRSLEDIERIVEGSSDEVSELTGLVDIFDDDLECEILIELLRCVISFSQQLGKTASSIFYESLLTTSLISSEDIVCYIVKILETGYCMSGPVLQTSTSGNHIVVLEKELADHKSLRKLSVDMFLSLQGLHKKASEWGRILKIAKVMFESAWDFLLFLSYLVDISGQVHLSHDDINKVQLELVPMLQEIIFEWLIIIFFTITPSAPAVTEDFNSKLSSLQIDNNMGKQLWNEKLGRCDFTLAFIFLLNVGSSSIDHSHVSSEHFSNVQSFINKTRDFISWIIWGQAGGSSTFLSRSIDLAFILFKHGQYGAAEVQCGLHATQKDKKVSEAIRCFFRSSSGNGASEALQSLSDDLGIPYLGFSGCTSIAAWKLQYYQWAMQLFERYSISEGACQFALAALEQVDEALYMKDDKCTNNSVNESVTTIKGRLWANVFIFALDLGRFYDAYCAIISNPDEESKYICLRRFIIVLYEQGAIKILCSDKLPLIGLVEKVEQELVWKADRSDISVKPNLYKLLYAFQLHRHNWRQAASYMYMYSARLRTEAALKDCVGSSLMLQERLNALSAAVNALHLVHPAYAWIDSLAEGSSIVNEHYPSKKAKRTPDEHSAADNDAEPQGWQSSIDIEKLENEFVLTSAEYMLSLIFQGFWTEEVYILNLSCVHSHPHAPTHEKYKELHGRLPIIVAETLLRSDPKIELPLWLVQLFKEGQKERSWGMTGRESNPASLFQLYVSYDRYAEATYLLLECIDSFASMVLKILVGVCGLSDCSAENLMWLSLLKFLLATGVLQNIYPSYVRLRVRVMSALGSLSGHCPTERCNQRCHRFGSSCPSFSSLSLGGTGSVLLYGVLSFSSHGDSFLLKWVAISSPVILIFMTEYCGNRQIYMVCYAAAVILVRYVFNSVANIVLQRPADIIRRKRPLAVWFPYTTIERLLYQLEELIRMGHMVDHCDKLKKMLHGSLQNHLKMVGILSSSYVLFYFWLLSTNAHTSLFVSTFQLKVDSDDAVSVSS
ncbi:hypothetical protein JHK84_036650 [Glycine max]|nr:hypothetical protein JHK85_036975 [Glycine max]KAG5130253.1 hypothetical protein JHK84_036650 [Glycine max]